MNQALLSNIIGTALIYLIWAIEILLLIRAFLSWIPDAENSSFGVKISQLTEPILIPFRRLVSRSAVLGHSMIDIAFIAAILVLEIIKALLTRIIG